MSAVRQETRIPTEALAAFCRDAQQVVGTPEQHAALVAASLTTADARNIGSHGVVRLLPVYIRRLRAGATKAKPDIQVVRRHGVSSLVDGDAGLGQVVGTRATQLAIATAREQPRMPGIERIYLPGEIEQEAELRTRERGIALSAAGWHELDTLANTLCIASLAERVSSARSGDGAPVNRIHVVGDDALAPG